ncbi:ArsR/SmtB family transcription factor [Olivibacter jilunii]|uniref:ArsR/SmtB family transcription factor n=1 Tax=Olivibacter jilunii TaxID=985016 RepID=UPI003F142F02
MNLEQIFKVLSNKNRILFLDWLKNPALLFPDQEEPFETGVCVGQIQKKSGQTISTVSEHLSLLQQAGLLTSTRKGKWIYYKRNEQRIAEVVDIIKQKL